MNWNPALADSAEWLLLALATEEGVSRNFRTAGRGDDDLHQLLAHDLAARASDGQLFVTDAGRKYLARRAAETSGQLDPFLAQHVDLAPQTQGQNHVAVDHAESPLAWLARRKGRDGQPLIAPEQLLAGERLRAEFTRAQLTPRMTSNWSAAIAQGRRGGGESEANLADIVVAARQRVRHALAAAGPEFAGLLLDVCCFLKRLDDVERERRWPVRSAKVVLQLGLDRLARHYGFAGAAKGRVRASARSWVAPDIGFTDGAP